MQDLCARKDAQSCIESTLLLFTPFLKRGGFNVNYLNLKIPTYFMKIIAQLVFLDAYSTRFLTKQGKVDLTHLGYCEYCLEENNFIHMITHCKVYDGSRNDHLAALSAAEERYGKLLELVTNSNGQDTKKLVRFMVILLNRLHGDR